MSTGCCWMRSECASERQSGALGIDEYMKILSELRLNPKAKLNPDQAVRVFNRIEETLNARP